MSKTNDGNDTPARREAFLAGALAERERIIGLIYEAGCSCHNGTVQIRMRELMDGKLMYRYLCANDLLWTISVATDAPPLKKED